jgi:transcriptional regulator with XRE-family HTH domain
MEKVIEFFDRCVAMHSQKLIAERAGVSQSAVAQAKKARQVSPQIAAACAELLGEEPYYWAGRAALAKQPPKVTQPRLFSRVLSRANPFRRPSANG